MEKQRTNRIAWAMAVLLAAAVLAGLGLLSVWLRGYWIAQHHGKGADLRNAYLIFAPLRGVDLEKANLAHADLSGAKLQGGNLNEANLKHARLAGVILAHADLTDA